MHLVQFVLIFWMMIKNEGCLNNIKVDIVFSLDESLSVSTSDCGSFEDTLNAVSNTVRRLNIDIVNGVQVGLMAIHNSSTTRKIFGLDSYNSAFDIQTAVSSVSYGGLQNTDLSAGLKFGCFEMFGGTDDRVDAPNYLIYLTHGMTTTTGVSEIATNCSDAGVTVGIVAIETTANVTALTEAASIPNYLLNTHFSCLSGNLAQHTYTMTSCQWYCVTSSRITQGGYPSSYTHNDAHIGYTHMFVSSYAEFKCCGRIYSWEFYAKESGILSLQVWKPVSGNRYQLVGVNKIYIPANAVDTVHTYVVPDNQRITVNNGDYFGWHSSGTNIIPYNQTGVATDVIVYIDIGNTNLGDTADFSVSSVSGSKYSIRVTLENDEGSIWFPDSGITVTVFDHLSSGVSVFNWTVVQKDQEFLSYKLYSGSTCDDKFTYTHNEGEETGSVTINSQLVSGQTHSLTFNAEDRCTHCNNGTLNVVVTNYPARILSLPSFYEIHEDADVSSVIDLHTIQTEDASGDTVACSYVGTVPSSNIFQVLNDSGSYKIQLKQNSVLDFDSASKYRIQVRCTDGKGVNDDKFFKVFLRRNVPPVITNMFGHLDWLSSGHPSSSTVVTPATYDADSTSFTYTLIYCASPPESITCPAVMTSPSTGLVQTNTDMTAFTGGGFTIRVNVSDGQTLTGPYSMSVRVYDYNDSPVIFNVPLADNIKITEAIPPFTWLYTVQFYDINNWDTLSLTTTISPSEGNTYFEISRTLNDQDTIRTSSRQINFEDLTNKEFTVQFSLNDGTATITRSLSIKIENENEGISFALDAYTIAADEGPVDTVVGDPGFTVTHIDSNDTILYTLDCGTNSRYYKINKDNGIVSFAWNMDVDKGYSRQAVCTVTAWDSGYLTAETSLIITVYDINDNTPRFDKRYYTFWISSSEAVGTVLGTIAITDADITFPHNYIERIWIENQPNGDKYFDRNETSGQFFISKNLSSIGDGNVLELTIYAQDYGQLLSYANITIIISLETTTTSTSSTTDIPIELMEDAKTTLWISCAAVLGMVFCGLMMYIACKHLPGTEIRRKQQTPVDSLLKQKKKGRGRDLVFRDSEIC